MSILSQKSALKDLIKFTHNDYKLDDAEIECCNCLSSMWLNCHV